MAQHTELKDNLYRGRFAPSPTGPLHFGSLVAALGSYLQARANNGVWLVRMEDIDPPREMAGAQDSILHSLESHGLLWDESVLYQSTRGDAYEATLEQLHGNRLTYRCSCSRKEIATIAQRGPNGFVYPGTCRNRHTHIKQTALRILTQGVIRFEDGLQGAIELDLASEVGDFVLKRADELYAYQLAVVVDDATQGISEIVRGNDLALLTPAQIYLQQQLGIPTPHYVHLPVVLSASGDKLSKQTGATALQNQQAAQNLYQALQFLNQQPDEKLKDARVEDIINWGVNHWNLELVGKTDRPLA
jgi:glutamyl-Q tRNA(Asp) synthetase